MANNRYRTAGEVFRALLALLKPDRKDISAIYLLAILAGLVQLSLPLGIQTIIGFVMAGSVSASLIVLITLVLTGTFLNGFLQVRQLQLTEKLKQKLFVRYSFTFSERLPLLDIEKLDRQYLPELVNRFFEVPSLQKGIEKLLLDIPAALIQVLLGLLLLSFYHPVFIGFGAILLLIISLILRFTLQKGFSASLEASEYKYKVAAWLQDLARMVKSFKYARNNDLHLQKTNLLVNGYLEARTSYFRILLTQAWSFIGFKTLVTAAMLIVGATLLVNQQINIGQFIAADIVIISIISSVEKLIVNLDKVYDSFTSIEKMDQVVRAETEQEGQRVIADTKKGLSVEFANVRFSYPGTDPVFSNLSFSIQSGERVLINGVSGSGKSSLLRLLTGAYRQYSGNILINGLPLGNYSLESLRANTAVLLSQQEIFRGSLLENLTMGNENITVEEVLQISTITGLHTYIRQTRDGLDTLLDPLGKRLTQEVRHQVLLMRALLGNSTLLLLEEPFAQLSPEYRASVKKYLTAGTGTTILVFSSNEAGDPFYSKQLNLVNGSVTIG